MSDNSAVISEQTALYTAVSEFPNPCKYDVKTRIEACTRFAMEGNLQRVSDKTGIPSTTLVYWQQGPWWHDMLRHIRTEKSHELDARLSRIIDNATEKVLERLEYGDAVVVAKTGELVYKPVSARDAMLTAAVGFDKRQLLRMQPTSIKSTGLDVLSQLATQLVDLKRNQAVVSHVERVDNDKITSHTTQYDSVTD